MIHRAMPRIVKLAALEGQRVGAVACDAADVEGMACVLEALALGDGSRERSCPVPIIYEAIAPVVDKLLRNSLAPDDAGYR